MKNSKNIIILLCILFTVGYQMVNGQIASDTLGCVPLLVKFTSPDQNLTNPIWDFKDGASSDKLNPSHVFSVSGTYYASLKSNNVVIAEVKIVILPALVPQITVDTNQGCAPITIRFKDITEVPANIQITGYLWDFGDGVGAEIQNPTHTYYDINNYDVTINLSTNIPQCNVTKTFEDLIKINEKQNIGFKIDSVAPSCIYPTSIYVTYNGIIDPTYSYTWKVNDVIVSSLPQPLPFTATSQGTYRIELQVDNNIGCNSKITQSANINFNPTINFTFAKVFCQKNKISFTNFSNAKEHFWDFGINASPKTSNEKEPSNISFLTEGIHEINLKMTTNEGCIKDTTFTISTEVIDALFTVVPEAVCKFPAEFIFTANNPNHAKYEWNKEEGGNTKIKTIEEIERDTFYYHTADTIKMKLVVESASGCIAEFKRECYIQFPNAQFTVNAFEGEAPFFLEVTDFSESIVPIVKWIFNWGDGTTSEYDQNTIGSASHFYENEGEYYVNLTIINELGCADYHYGAWIYVHAIPEELSDPPVCNGSGSGGSGDPLICINDMYTFDVSNIPSQIDAVHINFGNTVAHCESIANASGIMREDPGAYDIGLTMENGGTFYEIPFPQIINIAGAKAVIDYQVSCVDKYNVFFENKSINATKISWVIQGDTINKDTFHYQFPEKGDYEVILIAENEIDGCAPDQDTVIIMLRNVKSAIVNDTYWCDGIRNKLISTPSEDEVVGCKMGYIWSFPKELEKGNIISDKDTVYTTLPVGDHRISLEVRDVNGCRDTAYTDVIIKDLQADFTTDRIALCRPILANFTDISSHDTTLVKYSWSFNPNVSLPQISHTFTEITNLDSFKITLTVTDIIGCVSKKTKSFEVYEPTSKITFPSIVCESNVGTMVASDFTTRGSNLNYIWTLDSVATAGSNIFTFSGLKPGIHNVNLKIIENETQCENDYDVSFRIIKNPQAIITGLEDSVYCFPKTLQLFGDQSIIDSSDIVVYQWSFGDNKTSNRKNPVETFKKGDFDITLRVRSIYQCEDSAEKTISLVGPEGKILADKEVVCKGDHITFTLIDKVDVSSFFWDFGQGELGNDESPVNYTYNFVPESGVTIASLVLQSEETGCETVVTTPISIRQVNASFLGDTTCEDSIKLINLSQGANEVTWSTNNQFLSKDESPILSLGVGTYPIRLTIFNTEFGCRDTAFNTIKFLTKPIINAAPTVNICGSETFSILIDPNHSYEISPPKLAEIVGDMLHISAFSSENLLIKVTSQNGCTNNMNIFINHANIENKDSLDVLTICDNIGDVSFDLKLVAGDTIMWTLNGANIPDGLLSCTNCGNPSILGDINGYLSANIFNSQLCRNNTYTYQIENTEIEVPNVFSPNGDKLNDVFRPVSKSISNDDLQIESLRVVNRWGKEVYSGNEAWDGMINGHLAPAEVYYFTMTYSSGKYCKNNVKGDVTVLR
jgi:gliding motility-associated-like protein